MGLRFWVRKFDSSNWLAVRAIENTDDFGMTKVQFLSGEKVGFINEIGNGLMYDLYPLITNDTVISSFDLNALKLNNLSNECSNHEVPFCFSCHVKLDNSDVNCDVIDELFLSTIPNSLFPCSK